MFDSIYYTLGFYTTVVSFIVLTAYFFVFPLYKKRPVLIKERGLFIYLFVLVIGALRFFETWTLGIVVLIMVFLYLLKPWFVYGVTNLMLSEACEKAAIATRAPIAKLRSGYKIDNSMKIKQYNLAKRIIFMSFRAMTESKKAKLTKAVLKKFIQNYFI